MKGSEDVGVVSVVTGLANGSDLNGLPYIKIVKSRRMHKKSRHLN